MKYLIISLLILLAWAATYELPEGGVFLTDRTTVETTTGDYANEFAAADNVLREYLRDYSGSRLIWDTTLIDGTITVRVNARNGFGGYVGFESMTFRHGIIQ